jgi:hypothetical protein
MIRGGMGIRRRPIPSGPRRATFKSLRQADNRLQVEEIGHIADLVARFAPESTKKKA